MNQLSFIYLVVKNKEGGEGGFKERNGFKKTFFSWKNVGGGGVLHREGLFERGAYRGLTVFEFHGL